MGLFNKNNSGFKSVTIYLSISGAESIHIMGGQMTKNEVAQVINTIKDPSLVQRIKAYMNKHEVTQKTLSKMPKFTSHAQFDEYVRKELSPNAEWALLGSQTFSYLIVAEKK